ncbi:MAG: endonuclease Q family protein [Promethearchaeota archaeon]
MDIFNCDLHIHSPHSIAVSKSLNLDTMVDTCKKKGLDILATGDILQPDWLKYMQNNLNKANDGTFLYKNISFILQTEIEDSESIHHLVFFPDFKSVMEAQIQLKLHSKNILDEWGGRPRVNLTAPELVDKITNLGGLIGPAHAFTPFKAIFRQNKYKNLKECYQDASKNVYFLELGLSANTDLADKLFDLRDISFLSNSDAHSQDPRSLGREFNKMQIENGSFEEILLAIRRKDSRRIVLNVGLHPKLGKYYNMFCNKCRRRILFKKSTKSTNTVFNQYSITDNFIIYFSEEPLKAKNEFINMVSKEKSICPACKEKLNKSIKIKLGVSERIRVISSSKESIHPEHRPPYINAVPLIDIIRAVKNIKSTNSKTVLGYYDKIIHQLGTEYNILIEKPIDLISNFDENIASIIKAIRNDEIKYTPGGGGIYGQIKFEI